MIYVALLRGINVGGTNRVAMKQLKAAFETAGMRSVTTYINSGNVVFEHDSTDTTSLARELMQTVQATFGFAVEVLVKSHDDLRAVVTIVPIDWHNNADMKCDVLFLWDGLDAETVRSQFAERDGIDEVRTAPGVIVWKVNKEHATKSGLLKIINTLLYKQLTIRNINTTRKLLALMDERG